MSFLQYEDRLVRVTDDKGNVFTGTAETFPAEYGLHEYDREEEAIKIGEYMFFGSDIASIDFLPTYEEAKEAIQPGRYRHFKGNEYEVLCIARHSETMEPMVVYRALYGEKEVWTRPAYMWNETMERDGKTFNRFERIQ